VRPVGGACNRAVLRRYTEARLKLVLWDIDSRDSLRGFTPARIERHLRDQMRQIGARGRIVVLLHELDADTRGNIQRYIDALTSAAREAGNALRFPATRRELEAVFEGRADDRACGG
jgi:hypothetical protein